MSSKWVIINHVIASIFSLYFVYNLDKPIVLLYYLGWQIYLTNQITANKKANFGIHALLLASVLFVGTMPLSGGLLSPATIDINAVVGGTGVVTIIYLLVLFLLNKKSAQ